MVGLHDVSKPPHKVVLCRAPLPATIPENHILIRMDRFGFSANNVTYQALGEAPHFRYVCFCLNGGI